MYLWFKLRNIQSAEFVPASFTVLFLLLLLHPLNGLFSRTTWVSRYQKGKTSLDLNDAGTIHSGFTFLVLAPPGLMAPCPGSPGQGAIKRSLCVVCVSGARWFIVSRRGHWRRYWNATRSQYVPNRSISSHCFNWLSVQSLCNDALWKL